jgi:DNA-binding MarR family transcriptional regulator
MSEPATTVLLSRLVKAIYRRTTEEALGMNIKRYMALSSLQGPGALPQQELCALMHLDPNNCVLLLNELESAGYIQRVRDTADRRRHIVQITPAGRKAVIRAEEALGPVEDEVLGDLSAEEREALRGLLKRALAGAAEPVGA